MPLSEGELFLQSSSQFLGSTLGTCKILTRPQVISPNNPDKIEHHLADSALVVLLVGR